MGKKARKHAEGGDHTQIPKPKKKAGRVRRGLSGNESKEPTHREHTKLYVFCGCNFGFPAVPMTWSIVKR